MNSIKILTTISILFFWVSACSGSRPALKAEGYENVSNGSVQKETLKVEETRRDGQFIAFDDGTVKDSGTGLMWACKDNGTDITCLGAKRYCENYKGECGLLGQRETP